MAERYQPEPIRLSHTYALGPQIGLLQWAEPQMLVYPVGRHLCLHTVEKPSDSSMEFIKENPRVKGISCFDFVSDKGLLAIGELLTPDAASAQVRILDLNAQCKVLNTIEAQATSESLPSAAFDRMTAKHLVYISKNQQGYCLCIVDWQHSKFLTELSFSQAVTKASFNPGDAHQILVCGPGCCGLRLYKMRDPNGSDARTALKASPKIDAMEQDDISDFQWIDDSHVAALAESMVIVVNTDALCVTQTLPMNDFMPRCVTVLPHGLLLGGSNGYISFWEKVESPTSAAKGKRENSKPTTEFRESKTKQIGAADIVALDVLDDQVAAGLENRDIGLMSLSSFFQLEEYGDISLFEILHNRVHSDKIIGLDVAVQRNICITCSTDRSIRVWNNGTKQCETARIFQDTPLSVGLHPFGFLAAAAFPDKVRFFTTQQAEMQTIKEIAVRNATVLQFSKGGQYVAVAHQKGQILLITTRNFNKCNTLKGHQNHVTALCFSHDDKFLGSVGKDGAFYVFSLASMQRVYEHSSKKVEYTCIEYDPKDGGRWICAARTPTGGVMRVWENEEMSAELALPNNVFLTSLCVVNDSIERYALLAATSLGTLWVYPFPLKQTAYEEYGLHAECPTGEAAITHVALCDNMLVTVGHDASMHFITVGQPKQEFELADCVLANKSDVSLLEDEVKRDEPYASSFVIHNVPCTLTPRSLMDFFDIHGLRIGEDVDFFHVSMRRILRKRKFCFVHCTSLEAAMRLCNFHGKILFPHEPYPRACRIEINRKLTTFMAYFESYRKHGRRASAVFWPCAESFDSVTILEDN